MEEEFYIAECSFTSWIKAIVYYRSQGYILSCDNWQTGYALFKLKT